MLHTTGFSILDWFHSEKLTDAALTWLAFHSLKKGQNSRDRHKMLPSPPLFSVLQSNAFDKVTGTQIPFKNTLGSGHLYSKLTEKKKSSNLKMLLVS